jgi:phosphoserine phosphatase
MMAQGKFFSMEMIIDTGQILYESPLTHDKAVEKMKAELTELCSKINQSIVIQSEHVYKRMKKLVVFDVESTLIQDFSLKGFIEEINGKVKSMKREIHFKDHKEDDIEAITENARLLKGIPLQDFEKWTKMIRLNPGTIELIHILKSMGFKIALLSSGFNFFIKNIFEEAGVDYAFSNTLKVDDRGILTGELEEPMIHSSNKNEILEFIMNMENLSPDQIIAVGDGSTCSHFIKNVGLSIAFNPAETRITTDGVLSSDQIINMLYCLGIPKKELDEYLKKFS